MAALLKELFSGNSNNNRIQTTENINSQPYLTSERLRKKFALKAARQGSAVF